MCKLLNVRSVNFEIVTDLTFSHQCQIFPLERRAERYDRFTGNQQRFGSVIKLFMTSIDA